MKPIYNLKPLVLAMMPILFCGSASYALAQEANNNKTNNEDELEIIEVTGFKGSC